MILKSRSTYPLILAIPRLWERHHGLQNFFHRSLKSIGLTSSEGRNGETLGRHELNPRHLWYTTFWIWKMHVAIRLTMDEFQYLPGQICDSKLLQRNLAVHPISLMLHTSPRILTAWCRRQYGDPSRFPGVNLASALVSS